MNENTKTITFLVVALVVGLIAFLSRPTVPLPSADDARGQLLFEDFTDSSAATSLEIIKYDEASASPQRFKVALVDQRWSIPSHQDYPADAKDQLAEAAAGMIGLEILDVASDSRGDHELYGVVDPTATKGGTSGIGTLVTMKDSKDRTLMSLVIGKPLDDKPDLHYVRRAGQDPVYTVAVKTDKLSTKFEDWIEKDLLKLQGWDIRQVRIRDHSVEDALVGGRLGKVLTHRSDMTLAYDDTASGDEKKWKFLDDKEFKKKKWVAVKMAEDEELNTEKLDSLKSALDDLKIVDVARKPEGLKGDLKAGEEFLKNREAVDSLAERGFYAADTPDGPGIFSNDGEIRCRMKDGVEYVLRFGQISGGSSQTADKKDPKKKDDDDDADSGLNRYIFVMAEFNADIIPKPELEPLPEEKKPADAKKAEADKADAKKAAAEKDKNAKDKDAKDKDAKKDKQPPPDPKAERERIEKDNKRKQEEYDEKITEGKDKVKELNDRFADWYYVISDSVYGKIHLGRKDIIKKKEKKEEEDSGKDKGVDTKKASANNDAKLPPKSKDAGAKPAAKTPVKKPVAKTPAVKTPAAKPAAKNVAPAAPPAGKTSPPPTSPPNKSAAAPAPKKPAAAAPPAAKKN